MEVELSKEILLEIYNNINDLIFILNSELEIEFVNEIVHLKLLGYSSEDLIKKKMSSFTDIDNFKKLEEKIGKNDHHDGFSVNIPIYHKDGKKLWFEGKIKLVTNKKGEERIIFISKDISEKKHTDFIVKESIEKYQSIISTINEGYYEVDLKGYFTFVNNALCKFIGYSREELLGQSYKLITDKKTGKLVFKTFNKVFRTEIPQDLYQFQVRRENGEKIFFETSIYLKYSLDSKKVGFYGIIRDVTERKKVAELEKDFKIELTRTVRQRTKELEESEEKYSNLFQHSNDGIFVHDLKGNIIDANQKVLEQFGYERSEILTLKVPQLHPISEVGESNKAFNEISKKGFVRFEINFKKKNGDLFPAEVSSSLFTIRGEKFIQGVVRDITIRKKSDVLIHEKMLKLKELDQIRKNLISRVSHELKTPLVSVCGASELLLEIFKDETKTDTIELIEMIEKGGTRLKNLVENLLDITRIEYNKFELEKEIINLSEIISDCAKDMMYLIRRRKIELILDVPDKLNALVDKIRIEQVVLNLLSNAIKNTPPSGKIVMKLYKKRDWAEFTIIDTGIGLTREEMDRLFTRFGKIERYGEGLEYIDIQGSGLGLYISKEILDLHEGHIWSESAGRDKGCTFTINIPIE